MDNLNRHLFICDMENQALNSDNVKTHCDLHNSGHQKGSQRIFLNVED